MIILNVSGNLTANAIVRNVNGTDVVNFTIASNRRYKSRAGEIKEEVTFINCQLWDKKEAAPFLYKGRALNVLGAFNLKKYTAGDGSEQTALNLRVSFFQLFGANAAKQMTHTTFVAAQPEEMLSTATETPAEVNDDLPF